MEYQPAKEKLTQKMLLSICRKQRDLAVTRGQELSGIVWIPLLSKVNA